MVEPSELPSTIQAFPQFATVADFDECRRLHRRFGTTYYFATRQFRPEVRRRTHALYGFVRVPDEWVDNPDTSDLVQRRMQLDRYRSHLRAGHEGICPAGNSSEGRVLRAFCDVMHETRMPIEEPILFLDAMEQDILVTRYSTYEELRGYMRGSAGAVGMMMCSILDLPHNPAAEAAARALGDAMQLTNFLRDVGEDARRGRIYLPLEDMATFGVGESQILEGKVDNSFRQLMRFEIERARALYAMADSGIDQLPAEGRKAVQVARVLYARILSRIEAQGYDVFRERARTSRAEKLAVALRIMAGLPVADL